MNNVINSKITIYRNLKEFKFAHKLTNEQKQEIIKILEEQLKDKMDFINISTISTAREMIFLSKLSLVETIAKCSPLNKLIETSFFLDINKFCV